MQQRLHNQTSRHYPFFLVLSKYTHLFFWVCSTTSSFHLDSVNDKEGFMVIIMESSKKGNVKRHAKRCVYHVEVVAKPVIA